MHGIEQLRKTDGVVRLTYTAISDVQKAAWPLILYGRRDPSSSATPSTVWTKHQKRQTHPAGEDSLNVGEDVQSNLGRNAPSSAANMPGRPASQGSA